MDPNALTRAREERQQLQTQIDSLPDGLVKTHMLNALVELDEVIQRNDPATSSTTASDDPLVRRMKSNAVMVKKPQDALVATIHFMMQEAGFVTSGNTSGDTLYLPREWDKDSDQGIFIFTYTHPNQPGVQYTLKALFVGQTLALHIVQGDSQVHSLDIKIATYIRDTSSTMAGDALQASGLLRQQWTGFAQAFRPKEKPQPDTSATPSPLSIPTRAPLRMEPAQPDPIRIPNVGGGDAFPNFGGDSRRFPGMEVGPGHPLFGGRFGQGGYPEGPVPGARFDPYGPVGPRPTNVFQPFPMRHPRPPPPPFGGPDPDHLPMPGHPRDPDLDDMFG
ncbi:unnamed protein product [Aphanomyces euteiches]